jgi:hypothetical protein
VIAPSELLNQDVVAALIAARKQLLLVERPAAAPLRFLQRQHIAP